MRYYITARSAEDKQSLLKSLDHVIDQEPGSRRNILVENIDPNDLSADPRVQDIQPHPDDWPGLKIKLFVE